MKYEYGIFLGEECIEEHNNSYSAYHAAAEYTRESGIPHKVRKINDMEYNVYIDDVLCAVGEMDSILSTLSNHLKERESFSSKEINIKIVKQENETQVR